MGHRQKGKGNKRRKSWHRGGVEMRRSAWALQRIQWAELRDRKLRTREQQE